MIFKNLGIIQPILKALEEEGYTQPTEIQEKAIPILLNRKDLLGCAQTGTGKTCAFAVPIIQHLHTDRNHNERHRKIQALIVTPTRELAIQISESFTTYGKYTSIKNTVIFGGVKQGNQVKELKKGVDVLVATPGRLLDLINQGYITLKAIKYFVLDEADHMLDMGFIHDIRKIVAQLPENRQSLFFSATMPKEIVKLSGKILGHPSKVTVKPEQATAELVEQAVYFVTKKNKPKLLLHLLEDDSYESVLVFSRTKHGADKIVRILNKNKVPAQAIHGNKAQNFRQRALNNFKDGETRVLVATDIAARGIDVEELSLVINYDLPNVPETYVHRIGRTGRAKASGVAWSFCMGDERPYLKDIQKLIGQRIPIIEGHPFVDDGTEDVPAPANGQQKNQRSQRNGQNSAPKKKKSNWWRRKPKTSN